MPNTGDELGDATIYEVGYLVLPSIPEDKLSPVVDSIKEIIAKEGGKEIDGEAPFKHPLAYEMSKTIGASKYVVSEAYLGWIKFELEPSQIANVKASLEKVPEILRFLLVKASRESHFTFAKALALAREKEEAAEAQATPKAPEEAVVE